MSEAKLTSNKKADLFLPAFVLREIDRQVESSNFYEDKTDKIVTSMCMHSNKCQVCKATKAPNSNDVAQKVLWHDQVVRSGKYNFEACKFKVNNRINVDFMERMLIDYSDKEVCKFLGGFDVYHMQDIESRRHHPMMS